MFGFKSFRCARVILGGIEITRMICKGQLRSNDGSMLSAAQQFYSLAA
jgi:putative transposase